MRSPLRLLPRLTVALLAVGWCIACGGDGAVTNTGSVPKSVASCNGATELFTTVPVDTSQLMGWVPVGNLNPPGHTFPTDHQYIYLKSFGSGSSSPLYAPGAMMIIRVRQTHYSTGNNDYSVSFSPCAEVLGEFGHVSVLEPDLLAELGPFDQQCTSYSPQPGLTVTTCSSQLREIKRAAGARIGSTAGLDLSLFDSRIAPITFANPSRWRSNSDGFDSFHVAAFSDYYAEPMRTWVRAHLGSFDGRTRRTAAPIGGTIAVDVAGTAQGAWLTAGAPTYPEYPHITIAPDNVDPTRVAIALGSPINGVAAQVYYALPLSGPVISPTSITASSGVGCWEFGYSVTDVRGIVLVQLTDASTLKIEPRAGAARRCTDTDARSLGSAAVSFVR